MLFPVTAYLHLTFLLEESAQDFIVIYVCSLGRIDIKLCQQVFFGCFKIDDVSATQRFHPSNFIKFAACNLRVAIP